MTWGFQCGFADFDGDRYPELCISADFSTSGFYHNNRNGTFTNTTTLSGAGIDKNGPGAGSGVLLNERLRAYSSNGMARVHY